MGLPGCRRQRDDAPDLEELPEQAGNCAAMRAVGGGTLDAPGRRDFGRGGGIFKTTD
jgi:hypothetical protein